MAGGFQYDEARHIYRLNGQEIPSVTQVLKATGLYEDYSHIDPDIQAMARQRGRAVARACELIEKGTLDRTSVHPTLLGYVEGYEKFKRDYSYRALRFEQPAFHPTWLYAGTPDSDGEDGDGNPILPDIKVTSSMPRGVNFQTAAYEELLPPHSSGKPRKRMAIQLKEDGTYRPEVYKDPRDLKIFLSALTVVKAQQFYFSK